MYGDDDGIEAEQNRKKNIKKNKEATSFVGWLVNCKQACKLHFTPTFIHSLSLGFLRLPIHFRFFSIYIGSI